MPVNFLCSLFGKLLLAMLAFPPVYILAKYLRWCSKEDRNCSTEQEAESEA